MKNNLRLVAVLAMMLVAVSGSRAYAAAADNLNVEVHVTIPGTTDLQWAVGTTGLTSPAALDDSAAGVGVGTPLVDGTNDSAAWTLTVPGFGEIHDSDAGPSAAVMRLDNVGNRRLTITAFVFDEDNNAAPNDWSLNAAAGAVSQFALAVKVGDSGAGGLPAPGPTAIGAGVLAAPAYVNFAGVGAASSITLATGYKRVENYIEFDLRYSTPTEVNDDTEFDIDHVTTVRVVGTSL